MNQTPSVVRVGSRAGRLSLFVALVTALAAPAGHGFAEFGGGTLNFNAIAQVMSDSNVFGNTTDESDVIFTGRPELAYMREGSRGTTSLDLGVAINRFSDFSELNSDDWYFNGAVQVPPGSGRLSGGLNVAYFNGTEADDFLGQRADMERLNFALSTNYELSGRTSLRLGASLADYETDLRPSGESLALRAGVGLRLRPNISAFLDVSQATTKTEPSGLPVQTLNYRSSRVNVGLDGQLSATITGTVSVGYEDISSRSGDTVGDGNSFISNVSLSWNARQNTTVTLSGGQETRITTSSESIDATTVAIGIDQRVGPALTARARLMWETFTTRGLGNQSDDRLVASLDLEYSIHERLAFGGGVHHNVRSSFLPQFDISRTVLSVFGRFTF